MGMVLLLCFVAGFNEAGAVKPRKHSARRLASAGITGFNEAGAVKPRKHSVWGKFAVLAYSLQ